MIEIIAEIGQNHNGDLVLAKELIAAAKENGADVAKFQLYDAKALFPKENNPWFEYNCKTELSQDALLELDAECKRLKIEFMASVFDCERISWLEKLGVRRHKIASRSIFDKNLISALEKTNKPLLVSLGYWEQSEFPNIKSSKVDFLYCVSKYPTEFSDLHFKNIDFKRYSGFSDHTIGIEAPMIALSRGAKIIEKHFTLDKSMYGPDHQGSFTPIELKQLYSFKRALEICLK